MAKNLFTAYVDHDQRVRESYGETVKLESVEVVKTTRRYNLACTVCTHKFSIFESNIIRALRIGKIIKRYCPECHHSKLLKQCKQADPDYTYTDYYGNQVYAICRSGHRFITTFNQIMSKDTRGCKELCRECRK